MRGPCTPSAGIAGLARRDALLRCFGDLPGGSCLGTCVLQGRVSLKKNGKGTVGAAWDLSDLAEGDRVIFVWVFRENRALS